MPTVDTPLLRIAYEASGPEDGLPVVLVHGWPDDVRTWDRVLPALHAAGFRAYRPWLRGYGSTRFLHDDTFRSGQLVALGQDLVDFARALGLGRHALVGHDWGARAAYIASALNEPTVAACVALSVGYGTNHPGQVLSYRQTQTYWYHWFMATARGERCVRADRRGFTRHIWNEWFVAYTPGDAEFERTAAAFDNPDWADITLHSYRVRWDTRWSAEVRHARSALRSRANTARTHPDAAWRWRSRQPAGHERRQGVVFRRTVRAPARRRRGPLSAARAPRHRRPRNRRVAGPLRLRNSRRRPCTPGWFGSLPPRASRAKWQANRPRSQHHSIEGA